MSLYGSGIAPGCGSRRTWKSLRRCLARDLTVRARVMRLALPGAHSECSHSSERTIQFSRTEAGRRFLAGGSCVGVAKLSCCFALRQHLLFRRRLFFFVDLRLHFRCLGGQLLRLPGGRVIAHRLSTDAWGAFSGLPVTDWFRAVALRFSVPGSAELSTGSPRTTGVFGGRSQGTRRSSPSRIGLFFEAFPRRGGGT